MDCLRSFRVISAWFSGRLTFEPVVVVENCLRVMSAVCTCVVAEERTY